ncbi:hypothetical protein RRG08_048197 [Elysia crispata]|uniref:Uncharacterized protein n=1 Tax=Elysia crispata TaxID=231223 RepID=A0AAE1A3V6_9GAST|nr:hypothetical protein RRG08_048197 [Elysia crispata]
MTGFLMALPAPELDGSARAQTLKPISSSATHLQLICLSGQGHDRFDGSSSRTDGSARALNPISLVFSDTSPDLSVRGQGHRFQMAPAQNHMVQPGIEP